MHMQKGGPPTKSALRKDIPPSQTIYIKNLNEKIKKADLKEALYGYFSQFGPVLDIVAMKTPKARGQAFVVFQDIVTASNAMREANNFVFFGKSMLINYAKNKSDIVARLDGTFVDKQGVISPALEAPSLKRKAEDEVPNHRASKKPNIPMPDLNVQPNKVLFVQNLPDESAMMLQALFQGYQGYQEVRMVPGGKGIAFVEFANEIDAGRALVGLQGFRISHEYPMVISYQKTN